MFNSLVLDAIRIDDLVFNMILNYGFVNACNSSNWVRENGVCVV